MDETAPQDTTPEAPAERALGMDNGGAFILPAHLHGAKDLTKKERPVITGRRPRPSAPKK